MSKPASRLRFLWRYARADLFERAAWPTSTAIMLSVALATAGAAVALAVPWLVGEVRKIRQANDPVNSCLWVTDRSARLGGRPMTPARLTTLSAAVREKAGDRFVECAGFAEVRRAFVTAADDPDEYREVLGRTITKSDPLNKSIGKLLAAGRPFDADAPAGILVTRKFLEKELQYPEDAVRRIEQASNTDKPEIIKLRSPAGSPVPVKVRGVIEQPLPLGHGFILPEAEDVETRASARFITDRVILSPPGSRWPAPPPGGRYNRFIEDSAEAGFNIPAVLGRGSGRLRAFLGWVDDEDAPYHNRLPRTVVNTLRAWNSRVNLIQRGDGFALEVTSLPRNGTPVPLTDAEWRARADRLNELAGESGRFELEPADKEKATPEMPKPEAHNWATAYVRDLFALRPVADVFREQKLECDESAILQLEKIEEDVRGLRTILNVLVGLMAGSVACGVCLLGWLRARQKAAEVGMLRAMGVSDRRLLAISGTEAAILWIGGTAGGLLIGGGVLAVLLDSAGVTRAELGQVSGLLSNLLWQGAFILFTGFFCLLGTVWSVWLIARRSPITAIHLAS